MSSAIERLAIINPEFKALDELHDLLNRSESLEEMDQIIKQKDWTLDVMQVLLPISVQMWKLGLVTEEDEAVKLLATEKVDLAFVKSLLTGEFGHQPYAWILEMEIEDQVDGGKRSQDNIPTIEELEEFRNNAITFTLNSVRNFLFKEQT